MGGTTLGRRMPGTAADRYFALVCAVAVVVSVGAVVLAGAALVDPIFALFVAALTLTAPTPVLARRRADSVALTVEEIFLVPALVLMEPSTVVVAVALSRAVGLSFGSRWSPYGVRSRYFRSRRATFNVAQSTLAAAVAAASVAAAGAGSETEAVAILAAVAGAVVYSLCSRGLVAGMVALVGNRSFWAALVEDAVAFVAISVLLWGAGAMLALAVVNLPGPAIWIGVSAVLVLIGSSLTNQLARQRERLADLLGATQRIQACGHSLEDVEEELVDSARRLLACDRAALERRPPQGGELGAEVTPGTWLVVSGPLASYYPEFDQEDLSLLETLASTARPTIEQSTALAELRSADDLKAAVLASVSHDLRTPLATASGIADLLLVDEDMTPEERRAFLSRLKVAVGRVDRLVGGLLDLERYELGRLPEPADADVSSVATDVVGQLRPGAAPPLVVQGGPGRARIDAPALERVLENLLTNALKHSPPAEEVVLRWQVEEGEIHICVEDAGPGVDPERRAEIFEPFRHGSQFGAVGLGLWIARRFVELRGGHIWVDRSDRGGAAFHVTLPTA